LKKYNLDGRMAKLDAGDVVGNDYISIQEASNGIY